MNLYVRILITWIRSLLEPRMSTRADCSQWFRVWPHDLDLFGHMNNGRFLQIMDVARLRWLLRTGTIDVIKSEGWSVALGGNLTRFRKPLRLLARYRVDSRLLCWDDRWFYLEHSFCASDGQVLAIGMSRAAFRHKRRWVKTEEVMERVDPGVRSMTLPDHIVDWMQAEEGLYQYCSGLGREKTREPAVYRDDPQPE